MKPQIGFIDYLHEQAIDLELQSLCAFREGRLATCAHLRRQARRLMQQVKDWQRAQKRFRYMTTLKPLSKAS